VVPNRMRAYMLPRREGRSGERKKIIQQQLDISLMIQVTTTTIEISMVPLRKSVRN